MVDYFGKYFTEKEFDFHNLINDDFIQPVRILFKAKHYMSAIKLLLVAVDSVGFVEFGETQKNPFIAWLEKYSDLKKLGVTPNQLWEHRNSLLHMSNLESRKVRRGEVKKLVGYIGEMPSELNLSDTETGYYNMQELIFEVGHSLNRWINSYDLDREKISLFVERYDLIASDARMMDVLL
ncbi:MAG TPA: hypothetical protein VIT92_06310 [Burkholderiaceae bacterium]